MCLKINRLWPHNRSRSGSCFTLDWPRAPRAHWAHAPCHIGLGPEGIAMSCMVWVLCVSSSLLHFDVVQFGTSSAAVLATQPSGAELLARCGVLPSVSGT